MHNKNPYISEIAKYPVLSRTEEESLYPHLHKNEVKQTLVKANLRLALKHAVKFSRHSHCNFEDLLAEANMGLMLAIEKFDPSKGFRFSTYAEHWILSRMKLYASSTKSIVKKSHNKFYDHAVAIKDPSRNPDKLTQLNYLFQADLSLDNPDHEIEISSYPELSLHYETGRSDQEKRIFIEQMTKQLIKQCDMLSNKEKECLQLIYGLSTTEPISIKSAAMELGASYTSVNKLKNRALSRLKKSLTPYV